MLKLCPEKSIAISCVTIFWLVTMKQMFHRIKMHRYGLRTFTADHTGMEMFWANVTSCTIYFTENIIYLMFIQNQ